MSLQLLYVCGVVSLTVGVVTCATCNMQGTVDVQTEWYEFLPQFVYKAGGQVDFNYNITYSVTDSQESPLILTLYKQSKPLNASADCQSKLQQSNAGELANLKVTLNTENFWSGCEILPDNQLRCIGGRDFITITNTTFLTAVARCGKPSIRMAYKIGFKGYVGECQGTLVSDEEDKGILTGNILIVTIISAINTVILLFTLTFLVCRKYRLRSRSPKPITS